MVYNTFKMVVQFFGVFFVFFKGGRCIFMEEGSLCLTCAATQDHKHTWIKAKNKVTSLQFHQEKGLSDMVHQYALYSVKADISIL